MVDKKAYADANVLVGETCPVCHKKTLSLSESEQDIPYFGRIALFSMSCSECEFHKGDIESVEEKEPIKTSVEVSGEKDMEIRVVKSSNATVKIPRLADIEPGEGSDGYVTNVEGVLNRVKNQIESVRDSEDDKEGQKKAKKLIKKINRVMWGEERIKIIIDDPSGNSAIISEKAVLLKKK